MKSTFQEKASYNRQEAITAGIFFDLKNLLSTIKGKTILMMNRNNSAHSYQPDFNELVTLVDESIIRTELISMPVTTIKDLVCKPVRIFY